MKSALGASLKAEEQAVKSRFESTESVPAENVDLDQEQTDPEESDQLVRDDFTLLISRIKARCMKAGIRVNTNEVLRAGIAALDALQDGELVRSLQGELPVMTDKPKRVVRVLVGHRIDTNKSRERIQIKRLQFSRRVLMGNTMATITWTKRLS